MTIEEIEFYARKYFPHLTLPCAAQCIIAILNANRKQNDR